MTTQLPERINVMRVISYDVQEVRESLAELNGISFEKVKGLEIIALIEDWVGEDFAMQEGKEIWQDQDGQELDW
jgi:hypothetical protein